MSEKDKHVESEGEEVTANSENTENEQSNNELVMAEQNEAGEENTTEVQRKEYHSTWAESFLSLTKSLIIRAIIIYFISSFFRRPQPEANTQAPVPPSVNYFEPGTTFDMYVYLSESETFNNFNDLKSLIWVEKNLVYGDWYGGPNKDGTIQMVHKFVPSDNLKNNGSIYLHVYVTKSRQPIVSKTNPNSYDIMSVSYSKKMLNAFKVVKYKKTHNLLTGETSATKEELEKASMMEQEILSHWHPNLTISMVTDQTPWMPSMITPPLDKYIEFIPGKNIYKPVVYLHDYWNMKRDYQPLNNSITELELRLTYQPISLLKWHLYLATSMQKRWTFLTGDTTEESESEHDIVKEILQVTNPYLLGLTIIVSILHSIFEFLAFKNDIQFWNNRQNLEGLSVKSVFFNVFQSVIVVLYVFDNETNIFVRISCIIGLCIELWKINKVVDIKINRESKILGRIPKITFHDKGSYVESSTKEYDRLAFRYLSWVLFPLFGGYAVYSLIYLEHEGWYSWVLNMLYGFLLTFGFIMMTPQLFINYKLKSVAHLPWRMLSYKFLNTFIDDMFAFVIKVPTLYRIGCFRDDIIFIIFLYQRWIYKIDHTRVNEFGFSGEMEEKLALERKQKDNANSEKNEVAKKSD